MMRVNNELVWLRQSVSAAYEERVQEKLLYNINNSFLDSLEDQNSYPFFRWNVFDFQNILYSVLSGVSNDFRTCGAVNFLVLLSIMDITLWCNANTSIGVSVPSGMLI